MAAPPTIRLPDRYEVRGHVASGGMASVWEATDVLLGRTVAVKVLAPHFAAADEARARFAREARTAAQVSSHPHVVTVYDVGEHDGNVFIVMEHFGGGTVAQRIRRARDRDATIPRDTALAWLRDAAAGLQVAHAAGIVHRDVKPANLLLDAAGRVAVADFGIARAADDSAFTATGQVLGTGPYLSPEQALGQPATASSDCYALAVVAFELLTGQRPFPDGGFAAQVLAHAQHEPPRASDVAPGLPPEIDAALARGLAKDPARRPLTVTALVAELTTAAGVPLPVDDSPTEPHGPPTAVTHRAEPTPAPPPAPIPLPQAPSRRLTPAPARRPSPAPAPSTASPHRTSSRGPLAVAAVVALVLVAGAGAAVVGSSGGEEGGTRAGTTTTGARTSTGDGRLQRTPPSTTGSQPAADAPAAQEPQATQPAPAGAPAGSPAQLNDRGYALIRQERYGEAVPLLEASVAGYRAAGDVDGLPYAFALFNLGQSLNRSGRPAEAIPFLEARLAFTNQRGVVRRELQAAQEAVGNEGAGQSEKGKDKDKDD